jgi:hypothetical protein
MRRNVEAFMMAFDSNLAPIVGQQITRTATNAATVNGRIDLLEERADAGECDLVVKGPLAGENRGALYLGGAQFETDRVGDGVLSDAALRALANSAGQELTFTCVPPGSGFRIAIDHDDDGFADGDERDGGSDPDDQASTPSAAAACATVTATTFKSATLKDARGQLNVRGDFAIGGYAQATVSVLAADGGGAIVGANVPGVSIVPKGSGFRFTAPGGATGITRVTVREKKNSGLFKVTVKTKGAWLPGAANEDETTTIVTLNVGGLCFRGNATRVK